LISDNVYPSKQEIKKIKLVIIDELGDFIEFSDVLIEPKKNDVRIIDFPKQKEEIQSIEKMEEETQSQQVKKEKTE
jgi:hypothetical protein